MTALLFTASDDWISRAIRAVTGGSASHVGILLAPDEVVSAEAAGVERQTTKVFLDGRYLVATAIVRDDLEYLIDYRRVTSFIGDGYDWSGIIGEGLAALAWRWFRRKLSNPLAAKHEEFCSELVVRALAGIPEFETLDPHTTSPAQLLQACKGSFRVTLTKKG